MTLASPPKQRPLSPHLGIYRLQISSVMSILHRATGVGLALGLPVFVAWLVMLAGGADSYALFTSNLRNVLGQFSAYGAVYLILSYNLNGIVLKAARNPSCARKGLLTFLDLVIAASVVFWIYDCIARKLPAFSGIAFPYIGEAVLLGWTWAFFYHFVCGIRHLLWDAGWFLSLRGMHVTGWVTLLVSAAATAGIWLKIWGVLP